MYPVWWRSSLQACHFWTSAWNARPWKRPFAVGCYVFIFLALFGLGALSYKGDHGDAGYDAQLTSQAKATEEFMKQPFQPEVVGASVGGNAASADPLVAQGKKLFAARACSACHGEGGTGGPIAPALTGIQKKFDADHLAAMLTTPTPQMKAKGMPPVTLPPADMKALVAYLESL